MWVLSHDGISVLIRGRDQSLLSVLPIRGYKKKVADFKAGKESSPGNLGVCTEIMYLSASRIDRNIYCLSYPGSEILI